MSIRTIVFPNFPAWVQDVALDGKIYTLAARYNTRMRSWLLDIETSDGVHLIDGLRLVLNERLLEPQRYDPRLPPGELLVVSPSGAARHDPDLVSMYNMRLVYVEAASVATI